jgi:predicted nucleic-acid-binding protein
MVGIDTNVLVRYFAQDDPAQSLAATRFIEHTLSSTQPGHVSLVTLAEFVWVMRRVYRNTVPDISQALLLLLDDSRFVVQQAGPAWSALDAYRSEGVDFADALIAALDRAQGCTTTVTFDRNAACISGVTLLH